MYMNMSWKFIEDPPYVKIKKYGKFLTCSETFVEIIFGSCFIFTSLNPLIEQAIYAVSDYKLVNSYIVSIRKILFFCWHGLCEGGRG